MLQKF